MSDPNPFDDDRPFGIPKIGGIEPISVLTELDGFKTAWEWKEQKAKGKDGAKFTYGGQKPLDSMKLKFISTTREGYANLRAIKKILVPKPGGGPGGGSSTSAASGPPTFTIGAPAKAPAATPGGTSTGSTGGASASGGSTSASTETDTSASKTPDPGPEPPTVSLDLGQAAEHGVVAVSLKEWDGPKWLGNGSWSDEITFIQAKEPTPAGVGTQPVKSPDTFAAGAGGNAGGGGGTGTTPAGSGAQKLQQEGAGT